MASLALYWSVMIACYLLASRLRRYADRLGFVNTLLSISVYALVFVMGLRMGANREVTDNLGIIGVQALLVTALTMAFSMLGAFAVRRALHIDRNALPRGAEKTAAEPSAAAHADASGSKTSLIIFAMVAVGMLLGYFVVPRVTDPDAFQAVSGSWLVVGLCLLLAFVGFGMGLEGKLKAMLRGAGLGIVLVPLAMVAGSLLAGVVYSFLSPMTLQERSTMGRHTGGARHQRGLRLVHARTKRHFRRGPRGRGRGVVPAQRAARNARHHSPPARRLEDRLHRGRHAARNVRDGRIPAHRRALLQRRDAALLVHDRHGSLSFLRAARAAHHRRIAPFPS